MREGSLLAQLRHPNIAQLIDAGVAPSGQPYLVLEYIDGERIDHYAERRGLDVEARVRLFVDVLAAVALRAHSRVGSRAHARACGARVRCAAISTLAYRASLFIRRHRTGVATGAIMLLLIGATVAITMQMLEARRQRDTALYESRRAEFQARFAYQIMSEVGAGAPITVQCNTVETQLTAGQPQRADERLRWARRDCGSHVARAARQRVRRCGTGAGRSAARAAIPRMLPPPRDARPER